MSGTAEKDGPPVIPPKERSVSPDDGLLREEPLELESKPATKNTQTDATSVPTATAPSATSQTATAPPTLDDENPPPKPPRPVSQFEQNVATLAEAFPDVEVSVIKAVLTASRGQVEPAFNALLGMSDPTAAAEFDEPPPPPQPPRPRQQQPRDFRGADHYTPAAVYHEQPPSHATSTPASQMEADEIYARQLAEHYGAAPRSNTSRQGRGGYGNYPEQRRKQNNSDDDDDRERNFFDDDLPVIQENFRKGFLDTQKKFNKFISDVGKKLAGEEEDEPPHGQQAGGPRPGGQAGSQQQQQQYPQRYSSRYDADPEVIQGDFSHLELRDNTDEPRRNRPVANPNLFGATNSPQGTAPGGRKVGFANQSEEDLYRPSGPTSRSGPPPSALRGGNPESGAGTGGTATSTGSKWAPLTSVEPTPLTNDPFQLADSDDEHDNIQTTAAKTGPQESGTKTTK